MEKANQTLNTLIERLTILEKNFSKHTEEVEPSLKTLGKQSPFYGSAGISSFIEKYNNIIKIFNEIYKQYYELVDYILESPVAPESHQSLFFNPAINLKENIFIDEETQYKNNIKFINNFITYLESKFESYPGFRL